MSIKIGQYVCVRAKKNNFFDDFHGKVIGTKGDHIIVLDSTGESYFVPSEQVVSMELPPKEESKVENYIECAFVNGVPIKRGKVIGYNVIKDKEKLQSTVILSVVQEVFYQHPDTSELLLMVKEEKVIMRAVEGDESYPSLYMLMMAQENIKKIV
jgi:hypothetical protein